MSEKPAPPADAARCKCGHIHGDAKCMACGCSEPLPAPPADAGARMSEEEFEYFARIIGRTASTFVAEARRTRAEVDATRRGWHNERAEWIKTNDALAADLAAVKVEYEMVVSDKKAIAQDRDALAARVKALETLQEAARLAAIKDDNDHAARVKVLTAALRGSLEALRGVQDAVRAGRSPALDEAIRIAARALEHE